MTKFQGKKGSIDFFFNSGQGIFLHITPTHTHEGIVPCFIYIGSFVPKSEQINEVKLEYQPPQK